MLERDEYISIAIYGSDSAAFLTHTLPDKNVLGVPLNILINAPENIRVHALDTFEVPAAYQRNYERVNACKVKYTEALFGDPNLRSHIATTASLQSQQLLDTVAPGMLVLGHYCSEDLCRRLGVWLTPTVCWVYEPLRITSDTTTIHVA